MKKIIEYLLIFGFVLSLSNCDTDKKPTTGMAPPTSNPEEKIVVPSTSDDFWGENNCTRSIPKETVFPNKRDKSYSYQINKSQGYTKESMSIGSGEKMIITNKGCNSFWIVYSYFLPGSSVDVNDAKSISNKVVELVERSTEYSNPPINLKGKIDPLKNAVNQIGSFTLGEEFVLADGEVKETFMLSKVLDNPNGMVLIEYYFTMGPI